MGLQKNIYNMGLFMLNCCRETDICQKWPFGYVLDMSIY
jgi:hypothetical protein